MALFELDQVGHMTYTDYTAQASSATPESTSGAGMGMENAAGPAVATWLFVVLNDSDVDSICK